MVTKQSMQTGTNQEVVHVRHVAGDPHAPNTLFELGDGHIEVELV
jgi:hypothetical protein